jgi:translation elongation factor EF-Tu-like GTPase
MAAPEKDHMSVVICGHVDSGEQNLSAAAVARVGLRGCLRLTP